MSLFIYLEKEGTRRKGSGKSHVFWKLSRVLPSANLVWPVKVGLTLGRIRKGSCVSRGNVCEMCSLSFPLPCVFSLGSRSAVLRTGEREAWTSSMALGQDICPRESISARRRGGKFLMKTMWLKEQGKDRNHTRNAGNLQGWERRWIKCMKGTREDRQATNLWLWKTKRVFPVQTMVNTWAWRGHLVFLTMNLYVHSVRVRVCACVCRAIKIENRRPNKSMFTES